MTFGHTHRHYADCTGIGCRCETRRYLRVLAIALAIATLEIIGGFATGSIALWADAGHVISDMAAIVVSIAVSESVRRRADERAVRAAGLAVNMVLLALIVAGVVLAAVARIYSPTEIVSEGMIVIAVVGAVGNWLQHRILHDAADHATHRILHLHVLSDLASSIGVIIAGIALWSTGWTIIDPLISLVIAAWIGWQLVFLMRAN